MNYKVPDSEEKRSHDRDHRTKRQRRKKLPKDARKSKKSRREFTKHLKKVFVS